MKHPSEKALLVLVRMSAAPDYKELSDWIKELYEDEKEGLVDNPNETKAGISKAFRHILPAFSDPRLALRKHREALEKGKVPEQVI